MLSRNNLKTPKIASSNSQSIVFKLVRDHAPISRSGIAEISGLPLSAISKIVSKMIRDNLILEIPLADTRGQRRKRGIHLNPSIGYCMSLEYNPAGITATVMDTSYNVLACQGVKENIESLTRKARIDRIISFMTDFQQKLPQLPGKCLVIGVVDPGAADEQTGRVVTCSVMEDWFDVPIASILEEKFALPVVLLNGSIAAIKAVDRFETTGTVNNLIYIEFAEGIGCGLKLQGNYISGKANMAGEFGHLIITDKPIPCRCGAVGCLEAVAALPAIARNAKEAISENSSSSLAKLKNIDGYSVLAAAANGDRLAARIVDEAFEYLGRTVGGLVNTLDPEIVVFGNLIGTAGDSSVATLFKAVRKNVLPSHIQNLELKVCKCNTNIGALGGAVAAIDLLLEY